MTEMNIYRARFNLDEYGKGEYILTSENGLEFEPRTYKTIEDILHWIHFEQPDARVLLDYGKRTTNNKD